MKVQISRFLLIASAVCISFWQCTKPTPFGSELLGDQIADFDGEEVTVNCSVEYQDTLISADRTSAFSHFLCGQINDPEFGTTKAEVFSLVRPVDYINFTGAKFDSVFLVLPYYASGFYGDTLVPQTMQVFQLASEMDYNKAYTVYDTIATATEIGRLDNFLPKPRTLTKFLDTAAATPKLAYLKIPLSTEFGNSLLAIDSLTMRVPSDFHKKLKGIKIQSSASSGTGAMMAFNLNSLSCFIRLHYTIKDTVEKSLNYRLNWSSTDQQMSKFMHVSHDYTGTPAGAAVGQVNPARIFLQGMGGLRMKLAFPAAPQLNNVLINKAELQFYAANSTLTPVSSQLVMLYKDTDGSFLYTDDAAYSRRLADGFSLFGGQPETITSDLVKYQMTLTDYFQKIAKDTSGSDGNLDKRTIYIDFDPTDNLKLLTTSRTVIYGPGDATYPLKVRIKYTKL